MLFLLLVIQSLLGSGATQGISEYSPQLGTVFADGGEAVLTCKSAVPWYLCIWEGPGINNGGLLHFEYGTRFKNKQMYFEV